HLGQGLLSDENFSKMWTDVGAEIEATGFKLDEWFDAAMTGSEAASAYLQKYMDAQRALRAEVEAAWTAEQEAQSLSGQFDKAKTDALKAQYDATIDAENAYIRLFDATNILDGGVTKMLNSMD